MKAGACPRFFWCCILHRSTYEHRWRRYWNNCYREETRPHGFNDTRFISDDNDFGLIASISTGFLGMNLIAAADNPLGTRVLYVMAVFMPTVALTVYTVVKSKRLPEFLEGLSDERLTMRDKLNILLSEWKKDRHSSEADVRFRPS
jgi:hypothetical protein